MPLKTLSIPKICGHSLPDGNIVASKAVDAVLYTQFWAFSAVGKEGPYETSVKLQPALPNICHPSYCPQPWMDGQLPSHGLSQRIYCRATSFPWKAVRLGQFHQLHQELVLRPWPVTTAKASSGRSRQPGKARRNGWMLHEGGLHKG